MKLEEEISQKKFRGEEHKLGVNIIYTHNWLDQYHAAFFKRHGLTAQQFNILRILRGQHPHHASIKLIRERMLDKMSDASRIVEKLRMKRLVTRDISKHDRRHCEVFITEKGLKLLSVIDKKTNEFDTIFSALSKKEMKVLNGLLDKLRG